MGLHYLESRQRSATFCGLIMADWKGTSVVITIDNAYKHIEPFEIRTYLDTDTMADLFSEHPPSKGWQIVINADEEAGQ